MVTPSPSQSAACQIGLVVSSSPITPSSLHGSFISGSTESHVPSPSVSKQPVTTTLSVKSSPTVEGSFSSPVAAVVLFVIVLPSCPTSTVPSIVSVAFAPLIKLGIDQVGEVYVPALTFPLFTVGVKPEGITSLKEILFAVSGPLLVTVIVNVTISVSAGVGFPLVSVFTVTRSARPVATPLLFPSAPLSVLFVVLESISSAETVASLVKAPGPSIVAVTVSVIEAPFANTPKLQPGKPRQPAPPPATETIVRFVGVSVTTTLLAVSGPLLVTTIS